MERSPSTPPESDPRERAMSKTLGIPDLAARVLLARGIEDPDLARGYLRPDLRSLSDSFEFTHMGIAYKVGEFSNPGGIDTL